MKISGPFRQLYQKSTTVAIFLISGESALAERLGSEIAYGQTIRARYNVDDLIDWLKEARKLVTGNPHWAIYAVSDDEIAKVMSSFPRGTVVHLQCTAQIDDHQYSISEAKR